MLKSFNSLSKSQCTRRTLSVKALFDNSARKKEGEFGPLRINLIMATWVLSAVLYGPLFLLLKSFSMMEKMNGLQVVNEDAKKKMCQEYATIDMARSSRLKNLHCLK